MDYFKELLYRFVGKYPIKRKKESRRAVRRVDKNRIRELKKRIER